MEREETLTHRCFYDIFATPRSSYVRGPADEAETAHTSLLSLFELVMSKLFCCFRGGEEKDPVLVDVVATKPMQPAEGSTQPPESGRRQTIKRRRRVAVAAESTEQLANARWKSAFDAMRSAEVKSPELAAKIVSTLKGHTIFGQMESALLDEIVVAMRTTKVKTDEAVIAQGDAGDAFYVVGEGTLAAYIEAEGETPVAEYRAGDSFGELALLYDSPRAASVRCTSAEGATLYKLGRIPFRNLVSAAIIKAKDGLETRLAKVRRGGWGGAGGGVERGFWRGAGGSAERGGGERRRLGVRSGRGAETGRWASVECHRGGGGVAIGVRMRTLAPSASSHLRPRPAAVRATDSMASTAHETRISPDAPPHMDTRPRPSPPLLGVSSRPILHPWRLFALSLLLGVSSRPILHPWRLFALSLLGRCPCSAGSRRAS